MIVRVLILTGMFQLTACLGAQVTGIKETGAIRPAADEQQMAGEWRNVIKNVSGREIVALHVTFSCTTEDGRVHSDDNGSVDKLLQYETDRLIPPGGSYLSKVIDPGDCTSKTDAVVYANGEVEGDRDKIDLIFQRRSGAYKALSVVIPLLDDIASGKSPAAEVVAALQHKIRAFSEERNPSLGDGYGITLIFGGAISLLQNHAWLRTPSDSTPNRQPRIETVMETKGISLKQAHAFVTANKFREWQSALKDHLTPPGAN
jgi:hypothetical protein